MKLCLSCGEKINSSAWKCPSCQHSPEIVDDFLAFAPELAKINNGFNPDYFEQLANLESRNFWFRSRNRLIVWAIKRYFPDAKNFLEIGCGTGFVISAVEKVFPEFSMWGSEIYTLGLSFAKKRLDKAELFQMDARQIPYENEFDLIGAFDVLEHIEEDNDVLFQMNRAIRPGGGIVITVPQHKFLWSRADEIACHVRRYSSSELINKVENAGFRIEKVTSFVTLLFPLMILSRLGKAAEKDDLAELKLNSVLNTIFERVMDLERSLIRYFGLPFGGSLLLIARKE